MELKEISSKFNIKTLNSIIEKAGGTKCTSYKFGEGFKKGESYLSNVFRLNVSGVNEINGALVEVNLIVKAMPSNLARRKLFRSADFFRNEINFYTKVVPAWENFQSEQQPKHPFHEYPFCYAVHCDGENDFIALEDVSFSGFCSSKRQDYISLDDCILRMRTLGRFHGLSLAFKTMHPKRFEDVSKSLEETYYSEKNKEWYIGFLNLACEVARDAVSKTYPQTKYEIISNGFLQENLYDDLIRLVSTKSNLCTFLHGDCWLPNFLTRYTQDGKPESMKIIDFQLARCASVAVDLSFFIYSCTSEELRRNHYEEILKAYYESACSLIVDLGVNPENVFPYQSLLNELTEFGRFGCGMCIESLPLSMIEDEEVPDMENIVENSVLTDIWNIKPFKEPKKRERIAQVFKHAIDHGYIK